MLSKTLYSGNGFRLASLAFCSIIAKKSSQNKGRSLHFEIDSAKRHPSLFIIEL